MIWSIFLGMIRASSVLLYNINLGATHTTILSTRGVTIPIYLFSSATDSIRRRIVLFKAVTILTSDPKSEFLCQSSFSCAEPADPLNTSYAWDISHTLVTTYHPYCHSPSALTKYLKQKLRHQQAKRLGCSPSAQVEQNVPLERNSNGLFEVSMLALLKPWRMIADLKQDNELFCEAFDNFVADAPAETCWIIRNVEFFHECSDSARQRTVTHGTGIKTNQTTVWTKFKSETVEDSLEVTDTDPDQFSNLISEKEIYHVLDNPYSPCEQLFAEVAITIGTETGVLQDDEYSTTYPHAAPLANDNNLLIFQTWKSVLHNELDKTANIASSSEAHNVLSLGDLPVIMDLNSELTAITITWRTPPISDTNLVLNECQMMAYTIVTNHLRDHLSQRNPPQRLLIIHGQGGTGKCHRCIGSLIFILSYLGARNPQRILPYKKWDTCVFWLDRRPWKGMEA